MNYSHFIAEKQNKVPQASFLLLFSLQKVPPHHQSPKERKEEKKKRLSQPTAEKLPYYTRPQM